MVFLMNHIDDVFAILVILVTIIFIIVASGTIVIMAGIFAMTSMCYFWYKKFGEKISDWAKK